MTVLVGICHLSTRAHYVGRWRTENIDPEAWSGTAGGPIKLDVMTSLVTSNHHLLSKCLDDLGFEPRTFLL